MNINFANTIIFPLQVQELVEESPWIIYLETTQPDSGIKALPSFDKDSKFLIYN